MTNRDVCFLGFLALAYLYLEQRSAARAGSAIGPADAGSKNSLPPASPREGHAARRDTCPRDGSHPVNLRSDGAMWCHRCDEAYFPHLAGWDAGLAAA